MRVLLFAFSVFWAHPVFDRKCEITCSGTADNFSQYRGNSHVLNLKGLTWSNWPSMLEWILKRNLVDLSHCALRSVSTVSTWLSCNNECHTIIGVENIYGLGPKGFQIFPMKSNSGSFTVVDAQRMRAQVHYQVTGSCWKVIVSLIAIFLWSISYGLWP